MPHARAHPYAPVLAIAYSHTWVCVCAHTDARRELEPMQGIGDAGNVAGQVSALCVCVCVSAHQCVMKTILMVSGIRQQANTCLLVRLAAAFIKVKDPESPVEFGEILGRQSHC